MGDHSDSRSRSTSLDDKHDETDSSVEEEEEEEVESSSRKVLKTIQKDICNPY